MSDTSRLVLHITDELREEAAALEIPVKVLVDMKLTRSTFTIEARKRRAAKERLDRVAESRNRVRLPTALKVAESIRSQLSAPSVGELLQILRANDYVDARRLFPPVDEAMMRLAEVFQNEERKFNEIYQAIVDDWALAESPDYESGIQILTKAVNSYRAALKQCAPQP